MRKLLVLPFVCGCVAIFFVSGMERPPIPEELTFRFADKLLHAAAYGILGTLALVAALGRRTAGERTRGLFLEAFALASGYGALDEIHQAFVPGRSATVSDWVADSVGAAMVIGVVFLFRNKLPRFL